MQSSREVVPLAVADVSAFAKALRQGLLRRADQALPSHLAFLNLVAKSAGYRNFQALRAAAATDAPGGAGVALEPPADADLPKTVLRALRQFDRAGRLLKWPTQFAVQRLALWAIWMRLPSKRDLTERDVNETIDRFHAFEDVATLRRELVNMQMLWRTTDGRVYRKLTPVPSDEAKTFLKTLARLVGRSPGVRK